MDPALTPKWINALLQEYAMEVKEEVRWPVWLLSTSVRSRLWSICEGLGVASRGVPASACRILERFVCFHVKTYLNKSPENVPVDWSRYKRILEKKINFIIAGCVMLAAKMNSAHASMALVLVQNAMFMYGVHITDRANILATEIEVFKTLDYRMPLWTTTEISQFLAIQVGMTTDRVIEAVGQITNYVEFNRNCLENHLGSWVEDPGSHSVFPSNAIKSTVHNLHLCAAVVTASSRYMRLTPDPADQLAQLTRATTLYINTLTHIILTHLMSPNCLRTSDH